MNTSTASTSLRGHIASRNALDTAILDRAAPPDRRSDVNRWHSLTATLAVLAAAPLALAQTVDNDHCSDSTLNGDYAFTVNGQIFPATGAVVTRDGVAITHFDGVGNLTQADFVMQFPDKNGGSSPVPGEPDAVTGFNTGEQGRYHVFEDCTGEFEIDFPPIGMGGAVIKARFVLADHGRHIHTTVYSAQPPHAPGPVPALIHSEAEKQ